MKRKLLSLAAALLCSVGMSAYTTEDLTSAGWSEVTSLEALSSGVNNNVYVLVDAGGSSYFVTKGDGNEDRPKYIALANPFSTPGAVWTLESRGTNQYAMRNLSSRFYFNSSTNGYDDLMATSWSDSGTFTYAYEGSKFSITNSSVVTGQWSPGQYVGPWSDNLTSVASGENVACNKALSSAPGFKIYAISRSNYAKQYLSSATTGSPMDATFLLVNPMIYQGGDTNSPIAGWTTSGDDTGNGHITEGTGDTRLEAWHWLSYSAERSQTVAALPAGLYSLTASVHCRDNTTPVLFISSSSTGESVEKSIAMPQIAAGTSPDEEDKTTEKIYILENGSLRAGIKVTNSGDGETWFTGDNFRLTYYGDEATAAQKTALNDAITSAQAHTLGFDTGEYAPYENTEAITRLNTAITVKNSGSETGNDYVSATINLNSATWTPNATEENAFYDGDFSECAEDNTSPLDYTPAGWTASNNMRMMLKNSETYPGLTDASATSAMMSWTAGINYGETTGYTMPLNAYTIYELKFKAAGWNNESRSGMTVSVLNSSDGLAATDLGTPDRDIKGNEINTAGMTSYTKRFKTGAAGNYVFHIQSGHNFVLTDLELKKAATTTIDTDENYTPEAGLANVEMTRTIKVGYNTVCLPFNVTADQVTAAFGADSEVYNYSGDSESEGSINLTFTRNNERTISANVPVLVKVIEGQESTTQTFNGVEIVAPVSGTKVTGKYFDYVGVYTNTTLVAGDYFLATKDEVQQIFKSIGGDKVKPFRAYFKVNEDPDETGGDVKLFIDDEATGIDSLTPDPSPVGEGSIYNLAGQRMSKMQKGINIVNGKKILY